MPARRSGDAAGSGAALGSAEGAAASVGGGDCGGGSLPPHAETRRDARTPADATTPTDKAQGAAPLPAENLMGTSLATRLSPSRRMERSPRRPPTPRDGRWNFRWLPRDPPSRPSTLLGVRGRLGDRSFGRSLVVLAVHRAHQRL